MRWPSYSKYKPSGVEWLGDVPEHWEVKHGRFCMNVNPRSQRLRSLQPEDEVSFVPMEAVGRYGKLSLEQTRVISDVGSGYTAFDEGDVVVAKITPCFENGKGAIAVGLVNGAAFGTTELHVLRASPNLDRRFLFYFTISRPFRNTGEGEMYGAGGQKRIPPEFCKDIHIPLPEVNEQATITDFLDHKTGKIDTLVAKNRTLIERLKEKRSALISRTVTRGLPPDAARAAGLDPHPKLKPSLSACLPERERSQSGGYAQAGGVEWLGDVPEGWETGRIGGLFRFLSGGTPSTTHETYWNGNVPWVSSKDMKHFRVTDTIDHITKQAVNESATSMLPAGSVLLVVRSGILRHTIPIAVADCGVAINQDIKGLQPSSERINSLFFAYWVLGNQRTLLTLWRQQGATVESLNVDVVKVTPFPLPPLTEQTAIVDFLDRETAKIDTLVAKVETTIERLREYRTALITAAVTGKIDVRRAAA